MATTATLNPDLQRFPPGTTVKAYKRSNFLPASGPVSGAPQGTQDASATVSSAGVVSFTGLTDGTEYVLYASVSGEDRYARFSTSAAATTVTPSDGSVTAAKVADALKPSAGAAAGTESLRALGTSASTAAAGNDGRLSDTRTPSDGSVTAAKVAAALKPSGSAAAGDESLRALGTTAGTAAAGNDSRFTGNGTPNTQTGDYTLVLADAGATVEMNSASAQIITIPPNSSVAFPVGTIIEIARIGAGSLTITPGAGVTIPNKVEAAGTSSRTVANQWSSASLRKRATNVWVLVGDIA